ncbi:HNH endonuclease [Photobacterium damselae subsp. piscicida]|nr:HNH endonuclease [Photobacterium damselae subsp. piscicida]
MNGEQPTYFFKTLDSKTLFVTRTWEGKTFSHTFEVGQRYFTKQYQRCVEIISLQDQYHNTDCGYYFKAKYVNEDGLLAINGKDITAQATIDSIYHTYQKSFMSAHEIEGNGLSFLEGTVTTITVNKYERDRKARSACIKHYGHTCQACGFDFGKKYGALGEGFIEVHHLKPIHQIGVEYVVDPVADLVPLCANCHAMIHREHGMTLEALKALIA